MEKHGTHRTHVGLRLPFAAPIAFPFIPTFYTDHELMILAAVSKRVFAAIRSYMSARVTFFLGTSPDSGEMLSHPQFIRRMRFMSTFVDCTECQNMRRQMAATPTKTHTHVVSVKNYHLVNPPVITEYGINYKVDYNKPVHVPFTIRSKYCTAHQPPTRYLECTHPETGEKEEPHLRTTTSSRPSEYYRFFFSPLNYLARADISIKIPPCMNTHTPVQTRCDLCHHEIWFTDIPAIHPWRRIGTDRIANLCLRCIRKPIVHNNFEANCDACGTVQTVDNLNLMCVYKKFSFRICNHTKSLQCKCVCATCNSVTFNKMYRRKGEPLSEPKLCCLNCTIGKVNRYLEWEPANIITKAMILINGDASINSGVTGIGVHERWWYYSFTSGGSIT